VAASALAVSLPLAGAGGDKPPRIFGATAAYHKDTGTVGFSVEVHRRPRKVTVFHGGHRLPAHRKRHLPFWWQTKVITAQKRNCYRIRVKARNGHGLTTKRVGAGRLGSNGCS